MRLVVLYGPPAVGKLTVATKLSAITKFKLFHNHLTQDLARELYPDFGETRFNLVEKIRLTVIRYAAENNTDLLFTLVYSGSKNDDVYLEQLVEIVENSGGQVAFVELTAKYNDIVERVDNPSRTKFHKLTDKDLLKEKLENGFWQGSVKYPGVFKVDTSSNTPQKSAELIAEHFNLISS